MFIQNHDLITADRSPSEEGVCLYVKNSNNYLRNHVLGIILKQFVLKFSNLRVHPLLLEPFIGHPLPLLAPFRILNILVKLIDDGNKEFYLLGDLNSDMLDSLNNVTKHLNAIMELYQLTQTISSITPRVTITSSSLLDVCITPMPEKLVTSRVVPISISDH